MTDRDNPQNAIFASTGTFSRDPDRTDHRTIFAYGPELEVDGLEVIFYPDWYDKVQRIADELPETGLRFPAVHAEKSISPLLASVHRDEQRSGFKRLETNCRLGYRLESSLIVFHLWSYRDEDAQIDRTMQMLHDCISLAADHGLGFAVETIPSSSFKVLELVRRVVEADARCLVALDTEFLAFAGELEDAHDADWLWETGRVRHAHIKDFDGQMFTADNHRRYVHPGEGRVDFPRFFKRLRERGFEGNVCLEATGVQPDGSVDLGRIERSLDYIRQNLKQGEVLAK
jgi:sugar phosphate isomerase/epimerase